MKTMIVTLAAATALTAGAAAAQPYGYRHDSRWMPIDERQEQLAFRIDQGVRSGQLTGREAYRLRTEFNRIARLEARYRVTDGDKAARAAQQHALSGATLDDRLEGYLRMRELALGGTSDRMMKSGEIWAADRIFVHDQLQRGAVPPEIRAIAAAGDLTRVGEMGMSFGGATSGTVCMRDRRCGAGINLDGGDFPFQAFAAEVPAPFLMFHSDLDNIYKSLKVAPPKALRSFNEFSYERLATMGTRPDIYRVSVKGAQHMGLSDFTLFMRRPARDPLFGTTPTRVMIGAQNDFVLGFFDRHLRGIASDYPKAELKRYARWVTPVPVDEVRTWWAAKTEAQRAALTARIERARAAPVGASAP